MAMKLSIFDERLGVSYLNLRKELMESDTEPTFENVNKELSQYGIRMVDTLSLTMYVPNEEALTLFVLRYS
jgi:hypothetical protein